MVNIWCHWIKMKRIPAQELDDSSILLAHYSCQMRWQFQRRSECDLGLLVTADVILDFVCLEISNDIEISFHQLQLVIKSFTLND